MIAFRKQWSTLVGKGAGELLLILILRQLLPPCKMSGAKGIKLVASVCCCPTNNIQKHQYIRTQALPSSSQHPPTAPPRSGGQKAFTLPSREIWEIIIALLPNSFGHTSGEKHPPTAPPRSGGQKASRRSMVRAPSKSSAARWWETPFTPMTRGPPNCRGKERHCNRRCGLIF